MGTYVEVHGVYLKGTRRRPPEVVRVCDGDGDDEVYRAACELAVQVGIKLEDG